MRDANNEEGCCYPEKSNKNLRITVCANQGGRKYMEDRVHIEHFRSAGGTQDYTYVAVYDGHGGADASEFVRKNLLKNIEKQEGFNQSDEKMLEAIRKGFIETHYAMLKVVDGWPLTASGYRSTAGTTASVAFIARGKIFTGHVGDSAIIVGKKRDGGVLGVCLTVDHKPDNLNEEERINRAGGMVMRKSGIMRVVWTRPLKGHVGPVRRSTPTESIAFLAVARSLGDLWSYNKETKQFIVSPEPDVSVYVLDHSDMCLVLGSDGLTNVLKPQQIIDIVRASEEDTDLSNNFLVNHSRVLLRTALQGWGTLRADNITVVTVMFDNQECDVVNDPLYESIAEKSACNLNLDQLFTGNQTALVRITSKSCQELSTVPVSIVYTGALDQQFTSDIGYCGPGFSKQVVRDNPILPPKNSLIFAHLRRSASYSSVSQENEEGLSYCCCPVDYCNHPSFQNNVVNCSEAVFTEETPKCRVTGDKTQAAVPSEVQPSFANASSMDGTSVAQSFIQSEAASCSSSREDNESFLKTGIVDFEINEENKKKVSVRTEKFMNEVANLCTILTEKPKEEALISKSSFTSPISKPIAVVSPFEATPTSSSRKRLIPFRRVRNSLLRRRGAARRNLMVSAESTSQYAGGEGTSFYALEDEVGFKENGKLWQKQAISENTNEANNSWSGRSLGGASALSPMLMLAALRTPDQLMLRKGVNDPLRRELVSFRCTRYRSSVVTSTTSKLGQLNLGDKSATVETRITPDTSTFAQKRKAGMDDNANLAIEPAPKRSRLWGFFSSLIGDRKSK